MGTGVEFAAADLFAASEAGTALSGAALAGGTVAGESAAAASAFGASEAATATSGAAVGTGAAGSGAAAGSSALGTLKDVATILSPISSIIATASGVNATKRLGVGAPAIPLPVTMPIYGNQLSQSAVQNSLATQAARRGRASTILTSPDSSDKLGG